ncbi:MAG TPA: hypothetical protein VFJ87_13175 [Rhodanobacteraceae bacterium]|nr:hypothetical protein [Rhodanobacteraceae bacterium]
MYRRRFNHPRPLFRRPLFRSGIGNGNETLKLKHERSHGVTNRLLVGVVGMLWASSAMAMSYNISQNYENPMCIAVKNAFAEGLVLDATQPLCERRFVLSPKAKALGLSNVDKKLLPQSIYQNLLEKIIAVTGGEKRPQSE